MNISRIETRNRKLNGLARFHGSYGVGDAGPDDRKVSGPKCHRRARLGINVCHAEQDFTPNHVNQFFLTLW